MKRDREKKYVTVDVRFSEDGRLRPLQIVFDEEHIYEIDRVKDVCRRAADVGGVGDRYQYTFFAFTCHRRPPCQFCAFFFAITFSSKAFKQCENFKPGINLVGRSGPQTN